MLTRIALAVVFASALLSAQTSAPAFEVASVRQSPQNSTFTRPGSAEPGGRWSAVNATLVMIMQRAYPAYSVPGLIVGGPGWIHERRFDIEAKANGTPTRAQYEQMVQRLLEERFKLKVRTDKQPIDAFALVIAREDGRLGPRLKPASAECLVAVEARREQARSGAVLSSMIPACSTRPEGPGRVYGARQIGSLLAAMQVWMDRRIVDRTGLQGTYEMELEFDYLSLRSVDAAGDPASPNIFTALQEQLGLKLVPLREPQDVLVVESVEMPTPN